MDGKDASNSGYTFATKSAQDLVSVPWKGKELCPYHSLVVEIGGVKGADRFREFVCFDAKSRVYPEYIVAYKRLSKS